MPKPLHVEKLPCSCMVFIDKRRDRRGQSDERVYHLMHCEHNFFRGIRTLRRGESFEVALDAATWRRFKPGSTFRLVGYPRL